MATFKSVQGGDGYTGLLPGSGTGLTASVFRPDVGGTPASGDTIFHVLVVPNAKKATYVAPAGYSQIGSWVVGTADSFGTPAFGVFSRTYGSAPPGSETWTYDQDATRGACLMPICYSGNCTVQQTSTDTDASASGSRNGPTVTAPTGNLLVAFHGGSAVSNPGVTWSASFTERVDKEFYGIDTVADLAGDGTAKTPALTPTDPSQSMWIVLDLGSTATGGGGGTKRGRMMMGVG